MFAVAEFDIDTNIKLAIIDVPEIDEELKVFIDNNIVSICEGNTDGDITTVKKDLSNLFKGSEEHPKTNDWIMGATAEFFMHLFIRSKGFKQEFLYRNLEEDSIKKGFDGLYSISSDIWLMESKSGSIDTLGISHKNKVKEAIKDLSNKIAGINQTNNPWRNAYSHVSQIDVEASTSLRSDIKKLADDFTNGQYKNVAEFNTIPCGTIFLDGTWQQFVPEKIKTDIESIKEKLKGRNIYVLCMTYNTVDMFMEYIAK